MSSRIGCGVLLAWGIGVVACQVPADETSVVAQAIVYGEDDRVEALAHDDEQLRQLATDVVGALVPLSQVQEQGSALVIHADPLEQVLSLCAGEPWGEQMAAAVCSAVLLTGGRVLTAGHCLGARFGEEVVFVRGYFQGEEYGVFPDAAVHRIVGVLVAEDRSIVTESGADYAVGVLAAPPSGGLSLDSADSSLELSAPVVVMGSSEGLPTKIDDGGQVVDSEPEDYFEVTTDTFVGGSGSPVFTPEGILAGIIVGGGVDYAWDESSGCLSRNRVQGPTERAEIVVRAETVRRALAESTSTEPMPYPPPFHGADETAGADGDAGGMGGSRVAPEPGCAIRLPGPAVPGRDGRPATTGLLVIAAAALLRRRSSRRRKHLR